MQEAGTGWWPSEALVNCWIRNTARHAVLASLVLAQARVNVLLGAMAHCSCSIDLIQCPVCRYWIRGRAPMRTCEACGRLCHAHCGEILEGYWCCCECVDDYYNGTGSSRHCTVHSESKGRSAQWAQAVATPVICGEATVGCKCCVGARVASRSRIGQGVGAAQ